MTELNALGQIVGRGTSGDRNDPLEFMDEYATVMNRYVQIEVHNRFKEGVLICLSTLDLAMGGCYGWRMGGTALMRKSGGKLEEVDCLIRSQLS